MTGDAGKWRCATREDALCSRGRDCGRTNEGVRFFSLCESDRGVKVNRNVGVSTRPPLIIVMVDTCEDVALFSSMK